MWRRHYKTKFGETFKSAYRKHKNQLQIGQNELKTIQSAKEMLRNGACKIRWNNIISSNSAKTMYLVYERWKLS